MLNINYKLFTETFLKLIYILTYNIKKNNITIFNELKPIRTK